MAATFLMTLWDVLARTLTLIGEAVVAVLFFFGVSPETLQELNLGYFEVGFSTAVVTIVGSILGVEAYRKVRKRSS